LGLSRRTLVVFILLGLVSLAADVVYEGARSVSGPFLKEVGSPALGAAAVQAGELIGYFMRFVGGALAAALGSSTAYWALVFAGYALNAGTLPFLGVLGASSWSIAVTLYLAERVGKGLRAPARDVIIAEVSEGLGRGKGFGIHEVMDQVGAVLGPVMISLILGVYGATLAGYRVAFLALLAPGALSLALLLTAWRLYPQIKAVEAVGRAGGFEFKGLGRAFWLYTTSMSALALGYVAWSVLTYYLKQWSVLSDVEVGFAYALAMAVDAAVALPVGILYDKAGLKSLYIAPVAAAVIPALAAFYGRIGAFAAASLWGLVMGVYETNMRAGVADLVEPGKRAMAYGVFGLAYGLAWTAGAFLLATLFSYSAVLAVAYTTAVEACSLVLLIGLEKSLKAKQA